MQLDRYRQRVLAHPMDIPLRVTPLGMVGDSSYFTKGKVYVAHKERDDLVVLNVRDDNDHVRVITLDTPCPHFPPLVGMGNVQPHERVMWQPA